MSKVLRRKMVDELAEKLQGQANLVLLDAKGLTGNQTVELRKALREDKNKLRLVKNSVALHTFKKLGISGFEASLTGMSAVAGLRASKMLILPVACSIAAKACSFLFAAMASMAF